MIDRREFIAGAGASLLAAEAAARPVGRHGVAALSQGGGGSVDVAGVELVANGEFTSDVSGWTDNSSAGGAISWNSGRLATVNTTGTARARTTVTVEIGARYRFSVRNYGAVGNVAVGIAAAGSTILNKNTSTVFASQVAYVEFVATTTTLHIQLGTFGVGTTSLWDRVSLRKLTATQFATGKVFNDNFTRADGQIGVTSDDSALWRFIDPANSATVLPDIVSNVLTAPDSGQSATACYNVLTLSRPVESIKSSISFIGSGAAIAMVGMNAADPKKPTVAEIVTNALHIVFTDTKVDIGMFIASANPIETINYSAPLATDGSIYPNVGWSLSGATLTIYMPDGSTLTRVDARYAQLPGPVAIIEPFWLAGSHSARVHAAAIGMS